MIPLDVAVVVAWRRIGGIEVDHIVASRVEVEHVTTNRPTRLAAVEHDSVVRLGRLDEVLTQREPQVSPAVVVTQVGKREHPAGLLAGGGQHQCRDRQGSFVAPHDVDMRPGRVKEGTILCREVEPVEFALNEVSAVTGRAGDPLNVSDGKTSALVRNSGLRNDGRNARKSLVVTEQPSALSV